MRTMSEERSSHATEAAPTMPQHAQTSELRPYILGLFHDMVQGVQARSSELSRAVFQSAVRKLARFSVGMEAFFRVVL